MKRHNTLRVLLFGVALLILALGCACPKSLLRYDPFTSPICFEAPYSPPPPTFSDTDLVGTWETRYSGYPRPVDSLLLRADGTFKQVYKDNQIKDYVYETPWNKWSLERFPDGRVRVHLQGARYYAAGILDAERDGMEPADPETPRLPWPFYDPFADEHLEMVNKLVLNVRADASGELLLHHMWMHSDRWFALAGCEEEQFRRVETP